MTIDVRGIIYTALSLGLCSEIKEMSFRLKNIDEEKLNETIADVVKNYNLGYTIDYENDEMIITFIMVESNAD